MKLIVQPDAGVAPIVTAINQAKKSVDILIFRLDRQAIAKALESAVARGVNVRALIAHTNRGGEKSLRKLELRLLESGVTVSRTADDLVRYHGKMTIIDGRELQLYGFNFTALDMSNSRSLGIFTRTSRLVHEAIKLYDADTNRQPYVPGSERRLVVSPENARARLSAFIKGARKQLYIYNPKVSDDAMLRLLTERMKAGVDIKVLGKVEAKWHLKAEKLPNNRRLHVRALIRDGRQAFVGSQSLRRLELDERREIGVIVTEAQVVKQMQTVFERDWSETPSGVNEAKKRRLKKGAKPDGARRELGRKK